MSDGFLPVSRRRAFVVPILKKDGLEAGDVKNYRPISNLTFISKLIERLVYSQLFNFLEQHRLLLKFQSDFRKYHSTETAVLKVISDIALAADAGEVTLLGLLDMSAAFDTVDHSIPVNRLENLFGFSGSVLSFIESFLSRRTQQVVFNNTVSDVVEVRIRAFHGDLSLDPFYSSSILPMFLWLRRVMAWASTVMLMMGNFTSMARLRSPPTSKQRSQTV